MNNDPNPQTAELVPVTQAAFTSGPWIAQVAAAARDPEQHCEIITANSARMEIARVYRRGQRDGAAANAYLIAAAPTMFGDLVEAERMFRWYGDLHAAKPDPEKAARNYEIADRLAGTIASALVPQECQPIALQRDDQGGEQVAALRYALSLVGPAIDHAMSVTRASRDVIEQLEAHERTLEAMLGHLGAHPEGKLGDARRRSIMASVKLGSWMSAALEDPAVCEEMKADIREWFSAGEPQPGWCAHSKAIPDLAHAKEQAAGVDDDGGESITEAAKRMVAAQGMDWAELDGGDIGYWESLAAEALAAPASSVGEGVSAADFLARFVDDDTAHYIVGSGTQKRSVPVFVLKAIDAAIATSDRTPAPADLVEAAYREGHLTGRCDGSIFEVDNDWLASDAFKALAALRSPDNQNGGVA